MVYDGAARQLSLTCTEASEGVCHVLIDDGGAQKRLTIAARSTARLSSVSAAARSCSAAHVVTPDTCNWVPVSRSS
jgi:hypothetical protein